MYATKEIQRALLNEKHIEIVNALEMLGAAVDANPNRQWLDHESYVRESVEFIDKKDQVYACLYKVIAGELVPISERFYETSPLEPTESNEFVDLVFTQENGDFIIGYEPDNQAHREMHLHFRWLPLYSPENERYLVVAGVSEYSVTTVISMWVSVGQWISLLVTFGLNMWLVLLLVRLGGVYADRKGEKWRKEWSD